MGNPGTLGLKKGIEDYRFIHATAVGLHDERAAKTAILMPQALKFGDPPGFNNEIVWHFIDDELIITFGGSDHKIMTVSKKDGVNTQWGLNTIYGQL